MNLIDILRNLAQPVPKKLISQKATYSKDKKTGQRYKSGEVDYIAWYNLCDLLDDNCGIDGWEWSVKDVNQISNRLTLTGVLTIHGDDKSLTRMATGTEDVDCSSYGDPSSNAEAMALRRCCSKFGLGRDLWRKENKSNVNYSKPSRKKIQTFKSNQNSDKSSHKSQKQSLVTNTNVPKNSPKYWTNEGKQDALKGLEPQHPKIQPYMDGFNEVVLPQEEKEEEWNFSDHY